MRAAVRDPTAEKNEFLRAMGCEFVRVPDLLSDEGWAEAMAGCVGLAHVASPVDIAGNTPEDVMISQAVEGTERALRFAAEAGTVKRVVVTATMASICGSQREKNPDHLWSELDKNDAPQTGYSKGKTAAEAKAWELAASTLISTTSQLCIQRWCWDRCSRAEGVIDDVVAEADPGWRGRAEHVRALQYYGRRGGSRRWIEKKRRRRASATSSARATSSRR